MMNIEISALHTGLTKDMAIMKLNVEFRFQSLTKKIMGFGMCSLSVTT